MRAPPTREGRRIRLDWSPSHKCTFPNRCQCVCHSRALYYPAAMQVDRSRLCAAFRHALICMLMPPRPQVFAFLYLMEVIDQRQSCLLTRKHERSQWQCMCQAVSFHFISFMVINSGQVDGPLLSEPELPDGFAWVASYSYKPKLRASAWIIQIKHDIFHWGLKGYVLADEEVILETIWRDLDLKTPPARLFGLGTLVLAPGRGDPPATASSPRSLGPEPQNSLSSSENELADSLLDIQGL